MNVQAGDFWMAFVMSDERGYCQGPPVIGALDTPHLVVTSMEFTHMLCYRVGIYGCCPTYCPAPEPHAVSAGQEASMAISKSKTLGERIMDARAELILARKDGAAEGITKAARALDELIDELPRTAQTKEPAQ